MHTHAPSDYICPFCELVKGKSGEYQNNKCIVYEDKFVLAFVSPKWWVNNPGNVLVIPKKHFENIYDIPENLLAKVSIVSKKIALAMKETYPCDGVSTRQHNEPHGGQDVWHFHIHVFPRYKDDNLYQNHDKKQFVGLKGRLIYVKKLRKYFASIS